MSHFFLRLFLTTIGRSSHGVRLACTDGPTAGTTLSYAYRNQPQGDWMIGKWIDRRFLRYRGWEHVRQRLAAVTAALQRNIRDLADQGMDVHVLDIASGPADYLEGICQSSSSPATVDCRDRDEKSLAAGRARIERAGLRQVRFEAGDALEAQALLALRPRPTLVLSCGLYELFDEAAFHASLRIIAELLSPGGRFVMVHQVVHSDPRMVSDLFRRPDGGERLYLRTPDALRQALRAAGLNPIAHETCGGGWYVLITAQKEQDGPGAV